MDGIQIMQQFVPASPFVAHVGIELVALEPDQAELRLPFTEHVITIGKTVHGGAISALIDTAAMAAAWAGAEVPENMRGTTVGLTVQFLAAANETDLTARARVLRRGRSLVNVEVDVVDATDTPVAKGLVVYKIG
jgi:uncharacterized protein (TIGR00369 family)